MEWRESEIIFKLIYNTKFYFFRINIIFYMHDFEQKTTKYFYLEMRLQYFSYHQYIYKNNFPAFFNCQ